MSDMKCPVCKTGNVEQGKHDKEYFCDNEFCPSYDETDSSTYNILIRTRKALDVAVDALKAITAPALQVDYGMRGYTACKIIAESALTALEQKD